MAVSRDDTIKVEGGEVHELVDGSWTRVGTAAWEVHGNMMVFIADDPSRVHQLEQPVGTSERTLADSIARFILLRRD